MAAENDPDIITSSQEQPEQPDSDDLGSFINFSRSGVTSALYEEKCVQCPASDGLVMVGGPNGSKELFCALQHRLAHGMADDASQMLIDVEHALGDDPGCVPSKGGKRMRDLMRELNDRMAI